MFYPIINTILLLLIVYKLNKMPDKSTILAAFTRIQDGLTNVADDIRRIKDAIQPGMSQADVDEISAQAEALASKVETIAAETPEEENG
jgi:hypothetical protein